MSKLSFRARALDASKPMPIYMAEELPDLPEYSAINRAVPQMPSGMEKEEECEHHLQRAICAGLIIPTPEVIEADMEAYDKLYPPNYKQPRQLIHMQPFTMEQDIPDYDMDSEDERWLVSQAKKLDLTPLKFEEMMDRLEKSSGQTVVTLNEAKALLKEDDDLIIAVFDYWLNKRLKTQHPLILSVKTEHRVGSAANNPYLAFRRRTEKMQTRKNRKNDETSYEKMLKLRRDLSRAVTLLELVKRREKTKREYLHLTIEIYEKRYQAQDFSGALLAEVSALKNPRPAFTQIFQNHYSNQSWVNKAIIKDEIIPRKEKRQYKKRKHKNSTHGRLSVIPGSGMDGMVSSDEEEILPPQQSPEPEETEEEGRFAFRRNKLCSYHMPISNGMGNWPWCGPQENGLADRRYRYTLTSITQPRRCIGFARRRVGRGGRVILDRIGTDYDDLWRRLDFSVIETNAGSVVYDKDKDRESVSAVSSDTNVFYSNTNSNSVWRNNSSSSAGAASNTSNSVCNSQPSHWLSNLASDVQCDVKQEVLERTEVDPDTNANNHSDSEELLHLLSEVRREWLHFRPKTPPPTYEESTSASVAEELFSPSSTTPITVELQTLSSTLPSALVDESLFTTTPFTLHDLYPETAELAAEVPFDDTRQEPDPALDRYFGCSRFHVANATLAPDQPSLTNHKKLSILSSTLTSPKYNSVNVSSSFSSSSLDFRPKPTVVNHVTNGPLSYSELTSPSRKGNKMQHNAYTSGMVTGGRALDGVSASSTLNNERGIRLATYPTFTTTNTSNTLNSLSANVLDINSLSNESSESPKLNSQCMDNNVTATATTSATNKANSKQTIVRKNNSLPMEVT